MPKGVNFPHGLKSWSAPRVPRRLLPPRENGPMMTGPWRRRTGGGSPPSGPHGGGPRSRSERSHRSPSLFLGSALDDGAQAETQDVELGGDGLYGRQLLVGVAAALDQLLAALGG